MTHPSPPMRALVNVSLVEGLMQVITAIWVMVMSMLYLEDSAPYHMGSIISMYWLFALWTLPQAFVLGTPATYRILTQPKRLVHTLSSLYS